MLNLDLSQYNPVQSDSKYANVPLPSAHLVVIQDSEMKESMKDGYTRGTNLLLELTILASSTGNDFVDEKLPLYIPISGFEEPALKAGMKRLSTLAYTLGLGSYIQNKEDLHGQNFIVVLEKDAKSNFPIFKRILNANGMEIADASGNFKECELKDQTLAIELEKLLASISGVQQQQAQTVGVQAQPANNAVPPQNFAPQSNFGGETAQANPQQGFAQQQNFAPQTNFGQQQQAVDPNVGFQQQAQTAQTNQQPNFGAVPNQPQWGQAVNPNNGQ